MHEALYTVQMNENQRSWFYAEYERASKSDVVGVLLALFFGTFGIHHFYLHRNGLGVLYLVFSWTGIPAILGFIECFLMPSRVRQYNAIQAQHIASQILGYPVPFAAPSAPPYAAPAYAAPAYAAAPYAAAARTCSACGRALDPSAAFCTACGASTAPVPPRAELTANN